MRGDGMTNTPDPVEQILGKFGIEYATPYRLMADNNKSPAEQLPGAREKLIAEAKDALDAHYAKLYARKSNKAQDNKKLWRSEELIDIVADNIYHDQLAAAKSEPELREAIIVHFKEYFVADNVLDCIPLENWEEMELEVVGYIISLISQHTARAEQKLLADLLTEHDAICGATFSKNPRDDCSLRQQIFNRLAQLQQGVKK